MAIPRDSLNPGKLNAFAGMPHGSCEDLPKSSKFIRMPIYDYQCRGCGQVFEALVLSSSTKQAACPGCNSSDLEQMISNFAPRSQEKSKSNFNAAKKVAEKGIREEKIGRQQEWQDHH